MEPNIRAKYKEYLREEETNWEELLYQFRHQTETEELSRNLSRIFRLLLKQLVYIDRYHSFNAKKIADLLKTAIETQRQSQEEIISIIKDLGGDTERLKEIQDKIDEELTTHEELLQSLVQIRLDEDEQLEKLK